MPAKASTAGVLFEKASSVSIRLYCALFEKTSSGSTRPLVPLVSQGLLCFNHLCVLGHCKGMDSSVGHCIRPLHHLKLKSRVGRCIQPLCRLLHSPLVYDPCVACCTRVSLVALDLCVACCTRVPPAAPLWCLLPFDPCLAGCTRDCLLHSFIACCTLVSPGGGINRSLYSALVSAVAFGPCTCRPLHSLPLSGMGLNRSRG